MGYVETSTNKERLTALAELCTACLDARLDSDRFYEAERLFGLGDSPFVRQVLTDIEELLQHTPVLSLRNEIDIEGMRGLQEYTYVYVARAAIQSGVPETKAADIIRYMHEIDFGGRRDLHLVSLLIDAFASTSSPQN